MSIRKLLEFSGTTDVEFADLCDKCKESIIEKLMFYKRYALRSKVELDYSEAAKFLEEATKRYLADLDKLTALLNKVSSKGIKRRLR